MGGLDVSEPAFLSVLLSPRPSSPALPSASLPPQMAALPNPRSERGIDCRLRADRARCGSVETTPGSQAWPPRSIFDWRRDRRADWCRAAAVDLPRGSPGCDRDHPRRVQRVQLVAAEARLSYQCGPGRRRRRRYPQRRASSRPKNFQPVGVSVFVMAGALVRQYRNARSGYTGSVSYRIVGSRRQHLGRPQIIRSPRRERISPRNSGLIADVGGEPSRHGPVECTSSGKTKSRERLSNGSADRSPGAVCRADAVGRYSGARAAAHKAGAARHPGGHPGGRGTSRGTRTAGGSRQHWRNRGHGVCAGLAGV